MRGESGSGAALVSGLGFGAGVGFRKGLAEPQALVFELERHQPTEIETGLVDQGFTEGNKHLAGATVGIGMTAHWGVLHILICLYYSNPCWIDSGLAVQIMCNLRDVIRAAAHVVPPASSSE